MHFPSILFEQPPAGPVIDGRKEPECFPDLNLDQIVAAITAGRDEYNLKPFFYVPLSEVQAITYRHEVFRDLENQALFKQIASFAQKMRAMRAHLAQADKLHYLYQKQRGLLDAAHVYCDAVACLAHDLASSDVRAQGWVRIREYLTSYLHSGAFGSLLEETRQLKVALSGIRYRLHIDGPRIEVSRYVSEPDYGEEVSQTFEKFKLGAAQDYRFELSSRVDMNHVEAAILDRVAWLYSETFSSLERYCHDHRDYLDGTIRAFDREIQFYLAWLEQLDRFNRAGLLLCYPSVSDRSKQIDCHEVFDLALAIKLMGETARVVRNDFYLEDPERILVVSGANQGGKTTFARTFGQLHYLASLGCAVPARQAQLFLFERLFTHFEREEDLQTLHSKLEDDLLRIHAILEQATPNSILIMNESFSSSTLQDALFLSKQVMQRIIELDLVCVFVTFLDELSSLGKTTVSMVSTVKPDNPTVRTFKILRQRADGLAYAVAIAEKYRLTYESVKQRIAS